MLRTGRGMTAYFRESIRRQKDQPKEGLVHSLMTTEVDGDRLTEEEVIANSIVTMVGGQETTTNLIGNGVLALLQNPDQLEKLGSDLSLIPSAVQEPLSFENPRPHTPPLPPQKSILGGERSCT